MTRTRIAPSPTGQDIHIGNLYTALINYAFAKKHNGKFIVRIEDTDRERFIKGAEEQILKSLNSYGILPDESPVKKGEYGPYRQSERLEEYRKYAEDMIKKGHAYYCFCTKDRLNELRAKMRKEKKVPKYDKYCLEHEEINKKGEIYKGDKPYVIRLKVPKNKEIIFNDAIRGDIKFNSNDIDDQVLIKSDGYPTYHMAVVVDDHLMDISHVIRAEEWISSVPKHILIYKALNWDLPVFAHLPILRNIDKSKLSKRKNPVWASDYLKQGYLPQAVLNYLALMGWSHPKQKEIFTLKEFIQVFDLKDMQAVGPAFDKVKLEWMNGEYIRGMESMELNRKVIDFIGDKYDGEIVKKTIPLIQKRIKKLSDYLSLCEFFFKKPKKYDIDLQSEKELFLNIYDSLQGISTWEADNIGEKMQMTALDKGIKNSKFFMILRVALLGKKVTPPLNESMEILGKKECLERIKSLT